MRFPISLIDKDKYFEKINTLLEDETCVIFIDTNILAQLFRLYETARNEFFEWIDPLIKKDRVKTPVWVVNEYSKKYVKGQTKEYLNAGAKLSSIGKDFKEITRYLKMHVSDKNVKGIGYIDKDEYHRGLDEINEKLSKLNNVSNNNKEAYINDIHNEISARFSNTIIESDIYKLLDAASVSGPQRFGAQLPPGYKDSAKDYNPIGDLIIWQEILAYIKLKNVKKVIFLSNDNKADWMYTPSQIIHSGIPKPISNQSLSIADNRLVYEFKLFSGSDEFYIINTETLTQVLLNKGSKNIYGLAKALQIAHSEDKTLDDNDDTLKSNGNNNNNDNFVKTDNGEVSGQRLEIEDFCEEAYSDAEYFEYNNFEIGKIIEELRSYDWYIQNPAILSIYNLHRKIYNDEQNRNDWFVLGRNIYQAACGGSWEAMNFIINLKYAIYFPAFTEQCLAAGMFYEIFFDGNGDFRKHEYKTGYIEAVYEMQSAKEFEEVIKFMQKKLLKHKEYLVLLPDVASPIIELEIKCSVDEDQIFGDIQVIESIRYIDEELLIYSPFQDTQAQYFPNLESLKDLISNKLAIPSSQLKISFQPKLGDLEVFGFKSNTFIWKGPLNSVIKKVDDTFDLPF